MLSEQPVFGTQEMAACAHYLATQVGVPMLTQQDNALAAAITTHTIVNSSQMYIFAYPTNPCCDGLAQGWEYVIHNVYRNAKNLWIENIVLGKKGEVYDNSTVSSWNNSR